MSDELTLAKHLRAIASGMVMPRVSNGVTVSGSMLVKAAEAIEAPKGINNLTRYRLTNNDKARGWVEVPLYTTPQPAVSPSATSNIKEALERTIKFIESHMHYSQPGLDRGEEPSDMFTHEAVPVVVGLTDALATLSPHLVQDEAAEPTTAMIDAGVAFALSVSLSGGYKWPQYIADLYKTMRAAAIRSGRDGGAES